MVSGSVLREFCSGTCSLFLKIFLRATAVCYNRVGDRFCWQMPSFGALTPAGLSRALGEVTGN